MSLLTSSGSAPAGHILHWAEAAGPGPGRELWADAREFAQEGHWYCGTVEYFHSGFLYQTQNILICSYPHLLSYYLHALVILSIGTTPVNETSIYSLSCNQPRSDAVVRTSYSHHTEEVCRYRVNQRWRLSNNSFHPDQVVALVSQSCHGQLPGLRTAAAGARAWPRRPAALQHEALQGEGFLPPTTKICPGGRMSFHFV